MGVKDLLKGISRINFPWKKTRFVGKDYNGNLYFEKKTSGVRSKRIVEYHEGNQGFDYDVLNLPVQWQSWMRHTRQIPPTEEEILADQKRIELLRQKVKMIEEREEKLKLLEKKKY
ncbi:hypothetical protein BB559_006306 [Furculomyces boomerangus]|uniref:NADH dehydrogenase [ubiquinone] 1 alpha subcomplex subunit n=2 Tax=Harpellales TaxID=61421 RepID=A0A2T9Y3L5_9FUNG|nr:hypothetical protein BB559_006306 [Furculomyces boomerangus]PVZ98066.1 hypothetical protein BB558_005938 [Smittium angustum]